jgi:hypothetical protein
MRQKTKPVKISEEVAAKCDAPNQFENFDALVRNVLAVPHAEIVRRERKYKQQSDANPRRRGPKPKNGASPVPRA